MRARLAELFDAMFTPLAALSVVLPVLARRARWNVVGERSYWRHKDQLDALLFGHIAATRSDPALAERDDILALLVAARDESGAGLSDAQLRDELVTLISAGHETTASAIAWGADLLARHPSAAAAVREDGDAYLDAVVSEVLRLRSPIPLAAARRVTEPFAVGGWEIPPGVPIFVSAYGLHRDPRIYANPYGFRPERFIDGTPDGYAFLPFGGGAHRCLGS